MTATAVTKIISIIITTEVAPVVTITNTVTIVVSMRSMSIPATAANITIMMRHIHPSTVTIHTITAIPTMNVPVAVNIGINIITTRSIAARVVMDTMILIIRTNIVVHADTISTIKTMDAAVVTITTTWILLRQSMSWLSCVSELPFWSSVYS